jgi:hypothetical protein
VETVEAAAIGNELRPLLFEDRPDRLFGPLGVGVRCRPGEALVEKPGVQFVELLNRSRGVKKRSRTRPTWFSTCPFSQPEAGVQATGSTR